jgi:hypothetical protein
MVAVNRKDGNRDVDIRIFVVDMVESPEEADVSI